MWSFALWLSFLSAVTAKNDFPNEVVITSIDVVNKAVGAFGKAGEAYRIYACTHSDYLSSDDLITSQIIITDSAGKLFKLSELRKPAKEGSIFLSDQNTVVGPVTVRDPSPASTVASPSNFPWTIYLVSAKIDPLPVAAAMAMTTSPIPRLDSDAINAKGVRGVTFLSADAQLSMRQFNLTTDSAYIIPRGYDVQSIGTKDSVLDLNQQNAYLSYITIFGPIMTILNTDQSKTGRFQFGYNLLTGVDNFQGTSGTSLTLLSPNWLSLDDDYATPYNSYSYKEAFDRQINFGVDTLLDFGMSASNLKDGESVSLEIKDQMGGVKKWKYDTSTKGKIQDGAYGSFLTLKASVTSMETPATYPRFIVKVTAGATSTSVILSLMLTVLFFFGREVV